MGLKDRIQWSKRRGIEKGKEERKMMMKKKKEEGRREEGGDLGARDPLLPTQKLWRIQQAS